MPFAVIYYYTSQSCLKTYIIFFLNLFRSASYKTHKPKYALPCLALNESRSIVQCLNQASQHLKSSQFHCHHQLQIFCHSKKLQPSFLSYDSKRGTVSTCREWDSMIQLHIQKIKRLTKFHPKQYQFKNLCNISYLCHTKHHHFHHQKHKAHHSTELLKRVSELRS